MSEGLSGPHRGEITALCNEVESLSHQLSDLCRRGQGNTPQAQQLAKTLSQKLNLLKDSIQSALVNRVVEDFVDIVSPLKQFTDAVLTPEGMLLHFIHHLHTVQAPHKQKQCNKMFIFRALLVQ